MVFWLQGKSLWLKRSDYSGYSESKRSLNIGEIAVFKILLIVVVLEKVIA